MITGKLCYDIEVEASSEKELERIGAEIRAALKTVKGVMDSDEVDSDLNDDSDEAPVED